jgi:hypothetical protein
MLERSLMLRAMVAILSLVLPTIGVAEDKSEPAGAPVLDAPTLHCLGLYWIVKGDDNKNAEVKIEYRKSSEKDWHRALPLLRVERGAQNPTKHKSKTAQSKAPGLSVPDGAWLFAGSIFVLEPDTAYELKVQLTDPDGGSVEKTLTAKTIAEPVAPADAPKHHVIPGDGGGTGQESDPYKGIAEANKHAKPGDIFLLHAGIYKAPVVLSTSGTPGKPIIWRGAGDGEAVIEGHGRENKDHDRIITATELNDVWFEKLSIRNGAFGIVAHESARLVLRRCHFKNVDYALTATRNGKHPVAGYFVSDNIIEGPCTWPRLKKGIEPQRGVQLTGYGHVVCYNRIKGFADAADTFPGDDRVDSIDFHNNDVSELTDDGFEMDYSQRNTRCFFNRITNVYHGVTTQPVYGGPVYIFRNVMYNMERAPFKIAQSPSGVYLLHNTSVKLESPASTLFPNTTITNMFSRNNLLIGTQSTYAYEIIPKMIDADLDYDGFGGGPWRDFMKFNEVRYKTLEELQNKSTVYKHAIVVDNSTLFASGVKPPEDFKTEFKPETIDLRLKEGTAAIDAGIALGSLNEGFSGKAPDLGAYEFGAPVPHYGPRPEK